MAMFIGLSSVSDGCYCSPVTAVSIPMVAQTAPSYGEIWESLHLSPIPGFGGGKERGGRQLRDPLSLWGLRVLHNGTADQSKAGG